MNPTERRLKNELKRKRIEIMYQTTEIFKKNCEPCAMKDYDSLEACLDCPTYKQLRKLGTDLLNLSAQEKGGELHHLKESLLGTLTPDKYRKMKKAGLTDTKIAIKLNTSDYHLKMWKKEHIVKEKYSKLADFTVEEYKDLKAKKYTEKEIADMKKVAVSTLFDWRKEKNLA